MKSNFRTLRKIYWNLYSKYWEIFTKISPERSTKSLFKKILGYELNLDTPYTLNEKLQFLKLNDYYHNPTVTQCADKFEVREFVKKCGCSEILNELYGVWDDVENINWDSLPSSFVLKCNHGCGYNILCKDKNNFDFTKAKKLLKKWMNEVYGLSTAETIYLDIKPKIICEKYIETENGGPLVDYKFFCSYGIPKLAYIITGGHDSEEKLDYYTPEWEWIPVKNGNLGNAGARKEKPVMLDEMLEYASVLSKQFPIVRVDLYCEYGKIYFGELTFLATGGMARYSPKEYDRKFGDLFEITT